MTKLLNRKEDVYYISLLAVDKYGKPLDEYFTFDEASKLDLIDTDVKVMDVHQLLVSYKKRHPELSESRFKNMDIYKLVLDLIDYNPKASYFFDEVPFLSSSPKWYNRLFAGKISQCFLYIKFLRFK